MLLREQDGPAWQCVGMVLAGGVCVYVLVGWASHISGATAATDSMQVTCHHKSGLVECHMHLVT